MQCERQCKVATLVAVYTARYRGVIVTFALAAGGQLSRALRYCPVLRITNFRIHTCNKFSCYHTSDELLWRSRIFGTWVAPFAFLKKFHWSGWFFWSVSYRSLCWFILWSVFFYYWSLFEQSISAALFVRDQISRNAADNLPQYNLLSRWCIQYEIPIYRSHCPCR